jgi:hypothetical protein
MPQSLARIRLQITFSTQGGRTTLQNPDVREEMFRMLSHHAHYELLARWAGRYREQKVILVGSPYQGFALRWVNRRPFGAHIFRADATRAGTRRRGDAETRGRGDAEIRVSSPEGAAQSFAGRRVVAPFQGWYTALGIGPQGVALR